jgi:phosphohistidine phosphatase SixA
MRHFRVLLGLCLLSASSWAQPNPWSWNRIGFPDGGVLEFRFEAGFGFDQKKSCDMMMLIVDGKQDRAAVYDQMVGFWTAAGKNKWVLIAPVAPKEGRFDQPGSVERLGPLLKNLRTRSVIKGNRVHLVSQGEGYRSALKILARFGFEFASLTAINPCAVSEAEVRAVPRSAHVALTLVGDGNGEAAEITPLLRKTFRRLRSVQTGKSKIFDELLPRAAALGPRDGPLKEIDQVLDGLHDAASRADEDRYFGSFAEGAVFIGTDPGERWDIAAFKEWSAQYFKRESAWVYVPTERHVAISPDGDHASFDEVVWNAGYGECRGTGSLMRQDGAWKIAQYSLSVPIPNDIMKGVAREARVFNQSAADDLAKEERPKPRTVYLVRHAEKQQDSGDEDPALTPAGEARASLLSSMIPAADLDLVVCSEFKRTRQTAQPSAAKAGQDVVTHPAADPSGLARRLWRLPPGRCALVAGHSNTVGPILGALGIKDEITIADDEYDNLFVVTLASNGVASLQRLRFGAAAPVR